MPGARIVRFPDNPDFDYTEVAQPVKEVAQPVFVLIVKTSVDPRRRWNGKGWETNNAPKVQGPAETERGLRVLVTPEA